MIKKFHHIANPLQLDNSFSIKTNRQTKENNEEQRQRGKNEYFQLILCVHSIRRQIKSSRFTALFCRSARASRKIFFFLYFNIQLKSQRMKRKNLNSLSMINERLLNKHKNQYQLGRKQKAEHTQ